jgi:hypothetical protein
MNVGDRHDLDIRHPRIGFDMPFADLADPDNSNADSFCVAH